MLTKQSENRSRYKIILNKIGIFCIHFLCLILKDVKAMFLKGAKARYFTGMSKSSIQSETILHLYL